MIDFSARFSTSGTPVARSIWPRNGPRWHPLPPGRLESYKRARVRVRPGSVIHVDRNIYSVHSRLIGEKVDVRLYAEHLEVWYAGRVVEQIPRLRGQGKHFINYRHVIDSLVRKPGAFENYKYREDMFPTSRFRMAYDALRETHAGPGLAGISSDLGTGGAGERVVGGRCPADAVRGGSAYYVPGGDGMDRTP